MMRGLLKEKIWDFRSLSLRLPTLPQTLKTEKKAFELGGLSNETPLSKIDLDAIYVRFRRALETDDWEAISLKEWKNAVHVMWYGEWPLAHEDMFRNYLHAFLQYQKSGLRWKSFIRAYLVHFGKRETSPAVYREFAGWITEGLEHPQCYLWKHYHKEFQFFERHLRVDKTAAAFMEQCHADWQTFIHETGLQGELATCAYMQAVGMKLLEWLRRDGTKSHRYVYDIIPFFVDENTKELRFAALRAPLIEALLLPWKEEKPPFQYQEHWRKWLLEHFGDPRLAAHRLNKWSRVNEDAIAIMRKWQIGADIGIFFEIIDQLALDYQWRYRRKFWEAYFDEDRIEDACIVLGKEARVHAQQVLGENAAFWPLENAGGNQSVLILKIQDFIFAEWSHNGKCRVWHIDDKHCPKMNRDLDKSYFASEFQMPGLQIVSTQREGIIHRNSQNYTWQIPLAEFIWKHTAIRMDSHAYRI